jgi:hypothetical protein
VEVAQDGWDGIMAINPMTVNGVTVPTPYFPCVPQPPTIVRARVLCVEL